VSPFLGNTMAVKSNDNLSPDTGNNMTEPSSATPSFEDEALRESESRYKQLLTAITGYIYTVIIKNGKPVKTVHGQQCVVITGYSPEDFDTDPNLWISMVHKEDREIVRNQAEQALKGINIPPIEHRIIRKNGALRWIRNTIVLNYNAQGDLISYDGVIEDITERKLAEEALQKSEENYRTLLENLGEGTSTVDENETFTFANPAAEIIFGVSHGTLVGRNLREFLEPAQIDFVLAQTKKRIYGDKSAYELDIIPLDGEKRTIWITVTPQFNENKNYSGALAIYRDITEKKIAENTLQVSEERYRALIESTTDFVYLIDKNLHYLYANTNYLKRMKVSSPNEIVGKNYRDFHSEDGSKEFLSKIQEVIKAGESILYEHISESDNRNFLRTVSPVRNPITQEITSFTIISKDITEFKKTAEELYKTEQRYRSVVEDMPVLVCRFLKDGTLTFVNNGYCTYFKKSQNELIGYNFFDFIPETSQTIVKKQYYTLTPAHPTTIYQHQVYSPDGTMRWQEWTDHALFDNAGNVIEYQSIGRDITEQINAEIALKESEKRYRQSVENSPNPIFMVDSEGKIQKWNKAFENTLYYGEEITGQHYSIFLWNSYDQILLDSLIQKVFQDQPISDQDIAFRGKDGSIRYMVARLYPIRDISGKITSCVFANTDITHRKEMEKDLIRERIKLIRKISEERLLATIASQLNTMSSFKKIINTILEDIAHTLRITNVALYIINEKENKLKIIGCGFINYVTRPIQCMSNILIKKLPKEIQNCLKNGDIVKISNTTDLPPQSCEFFTAQNIDAVLIIPLKIGKNLIGTLNFTQNHPDVWKPEIYEVCQTIANIIASTMERNHNVKTRIEAEKKQTEAVKLAERASRLASIGTLTTGITHEINQPLNALKVTVDGMLFWDKHNYEIPRTELLENLNFIAKQASRIEDIIKQMRVLVYREKGTNPALMNVNEVIQKAFSLINQQLMAHNIAVDFDLYDQLPQVFGFPMQMEQVILNLAINSVNALDEFKIENKNVTVLTTVEKGKCKIEILDNGPGISPENLEKIFYPFFTTKTGGERMGFGLSIAQNIVNEMGGTITAHNRKTGGARFVILLPGEEKQPEA